MSRRTWLYLALASVGLLTGLAWLKWPSEGGNFFAEALGIIMTVAVVDRLIKWEEDARLAPARLAALRDALALTREATELVLALARSSVPATELPRVQQAKAKHGHLETWLAGHLATIRANSPAPYGAPPPWGTGFQTWGVMLPTLAENVKELIGRYLERHTTHGDPKLSEAINDLEGNGLFRSLSYGTDLFFFGQNEIRATMFESYLTKLQRLLDVVSELSSREPNRKELADRSKFNWNLLEVELTSHPKLHETEAPWRPA